MASEVGQKRVEVREGWFREFARYWPYRVPIQIIQGDFRRPEDVMEELRTADPDAHALLSEHLVITRREA